MNGPQGSLFRLFPETGRSSIKFPLRLFQLHARKAVVSFASKPKPCKRLPADTALLPSSVGATECNRTGSVQNMDLAGVSGLRLPEQHPGTAKPQQPTFGHRGYQTGESRPLSVAGGIDHAKLHELPFVRSHGQQQLYGDLRHNGGNDDLRRWQAPYGSQEAESPESKWMLSRSRNP